MDWKKTVLICCLILVGGGLITTLIFLTEPTAKRTGATKETAMLVDVISVKRGTFNPNIQAMGTVEPSQDITLSPRISGQVLWRSPEFTPGGFVEKGDTLLQIDPADYKSALEQRKSELRQAKADMNIEMGRQEVALEEYKMIGDTLSAGNRALVLREPQLESARSRVESAQAAVEQARLNLERTTIEAPFNAHILTRNVNVGSQVAPGENLGRLVGLETYWVEATVPLSHIRWLRFPDKNQRHGSEVRIQNRTAWAPDEYRTGHLYRNIGALEEQTRMARVLITVQDPLAYHTENSNLPPLTIGAFVETNIKAQQLTDVVRLNRDYIRKDETIWVMKDQALDIRDVNIKFRDQTYAYITSGLNHGEQVVTTNLSTITEGAPLRLGSNAPSDTAEADN